MKLNEMSKKAKYIALGVGVAFVLTAVGVSTYSGPAPRVVVEGDYIEAQEASLGSTNNDRINANSNFDETCVVDPSQSKLLCRGVLTGTMPATGVATTTEYVKNSIGQAAYIDTDDALVQLSGTVSSSVDISMGTSTATGLALYTSAAPTNIIAAARIATSTVGASDAGLVRSTSSLNSLYWANGETILISWKQSFENGCTGAKCEAVTSTNRGYNATYVIPYFYFKNNQ